MPGTRAQSWAARDPRTTLRVVGRRRATRRLFIVPETTSREVRVGGHREGSTGRVRVGQARAIDGYSRQVVEAAEVTLGITRVLPPSPPAARGSA